MRVFLQGLRIWFFFLLTSFGILFLIDGREVCL